MTLLLPIRKASATLCPQWPATIQSQHKATLHLPHKVTLQWHPWKKANCLCHLWNNHPLLQTTSLTTQKLLTVSTRNSLNSWFKFWRSPNLSSLCNNQRQTTWQGVSASQQHWATFIIRSNSSSSWKEPFWCTRVWSHRFKTCLRRYSSTCGWRLLHCSRWNTLYSWCQSRPNLPMSSKMPQQTST